MAQNEFSDYGAIIVSELSLHSLRSKFISNLSLRVRRSSLPWVHRCIL